MSGLEGLRSRPRAIRAGAVITLLALAACSEGRTSDGGITRRDAGTLDAAALDATTDVPDASDVDAAATDAALDAATDAAAGDAEVLDGAVEDAGSDVVRVTFRVTVPVNTPAGDPVHIAGDFQGWDPADPAYALTAVGGRIHEITLDFTPGQRLEFKFARGSWSRVEKGPSGEEIANRTHVADASGVVELTVASWADASPNPSTRSGDVSEVTVPNFLGGRRVWIYLPPGYSSEDPNIRHPVLYMLDGQNVFDLQTSFAGEWQVDEALEAGIPAGEIQALIVVAIDNGGSARIDEYTPWPGDYMGSTRGGGGPAHVQELVDVLKPWVDATYRTRPEPEHTGFGGSSLGGLMGIYVAYSYSSVFGRIAALSPSVWWDDEHLVDHVTAGAKPNVRIWTDMGTNEGSLDPFRLLRAALLADGFVEGQDLTAVEIPGAGHNEPAWAARMPDVLRFLFPGP